LQQEGDARARQLAAAHQAKLAALNAELEAGFRELETDGERTLRKAGAEGPIGFSRSVEARFIGQGSETSLPVPEGDFGTLDQALLRRRFDENYARLYGRTYPESPVEFVNFCVRASLPVKLLALPRLAHKGRTADAVKGERSAFCGRAREFLPHTVYDRYRLAPDAQTVGPAIFEERESTVIVGAGARVRVDEFGFLWITPPDGEQP